MTRNFKILATSEVSRNDPMVRVLKVFLAGGTPRRGLGFKERSDGEGTERRWQR